MAPAAWAAAMASASPGRSGARCSSPTPCATGAPTRSPGPSRTPSWGTPPPGTPRRLARRRGPRCTPRGRRGRPPRSRAPRGSRAPRCRGAPRCPWRRGARRAGRAGDRRGRRRPSPRRPSRRSLSRPLRPSRLSSFRTSGVAGAAAGAWAGAGWGSAPNRLLSRAARWALDERDVQASLGWLEALPVGVQRRTVALRIRLKASRMARQTAVALETARLLAKHRAFSPVAAQSLLRGLIADLIHGAHDLAQPHRQGCRCFPWFLSLIHI